MQCFVQALDSCACKAIFGHWPCHAKNRLGRHVLIKPTKIKMCMLELKNMTLLRPQEQLPILTLN